LATLHEKGTVASSSSEEQPTMIRQQPQTRHRQRTARRTTQSKDGLSAAKDEGSQPLLASELFAALGTRDPAKAALAGGGRECLSFGGSGG